MAITSTMNRWDSASSKWIPVTDISLIVSDSGGGSGSMACVAILDTTTNIEMFDAKPYTKLLEVVIL